LKLRLNCYIAINTETFQNDFTTHNFDLICF